MGKASLKRQRTPETTADTEDLSKFTDFTRKIIFRNIRMVVNRAYFVPHIIRLFSIFVVRVT